MRRTKSTRFGLTLGIWTKGYKKILSLVSWHSKEPVMDIISTIQTFPHSYVERNAIKSGETKSGNKLDILDLTS